MKKFRLWNVFCISIVLSTVVPLRAEVKLPALLSDHAVLQRDQPVRVWGWSDPAEQITIAFNKQVVTTVADSIGMWEGWLRPEQAGGPYTLRVSGSATPKPLEVIDVLVGDVWVASGQSNMEFPLKGFPRAPMKDSEKEISIASHATLRMLVQKRVVSSVELADGAATWSQCTPLTAGNFSAVAYFFAREVGEREHIPIGVIDATWGGTPAHAWISPEGIANHHLASVYADAGRIAENQGRADEIRGAYARTDAALRAEGKTVPVHPAIFEDHGDSWTPGTLFNGMIAPDTKYTIKGVIWYQGETDGGPFRGPNYGSVFAALIQDWRARWGQGDFPFFYVQISSFETSARWWGDVRDGQRRALGLTNTGMAVTLDIGVANNVHPPDKQTVGHRLALAALGTVYRENGEYSSPRFVQATTEAGAMRVWFTHADGLKNTGTVLGDFEVAGQDHAFFPATASIEQIGSNDTVVVASDKVPNPLYVRYGWSGVVNSYLYNAAGLPLGTFSSER